MRILVDVDGVQANLTTPFLNILHRYWDVTKTEADWVDWCPVKAGICDIQEQADAIFRMIGHHVHAFADLPGSRAGVQSLRDAGHQVIALTAPIHTPEWLYGRATWLKMRGFTDRTIVFTRDKSLIPGDVLIEDNPEYAREWAAAHPRGAVLLYDQPWNRSAVVPSNGRRVKSWAQVLDSVVSVMHSDACWGFPCENGELCR